jgi:hypothetical protein
MPGMCSNLVAYTELMNVMGKKTAVKMVRT